MSLPRGTGLYSDTCKIESYTTTLSQCALMEVAQWANPAVRSYQAALLGPLTQLMTIAIESSDTGRDLPTA